MTSPRTLQASFAATFVDELVRGGLREAVICPGSRSTPLVLALARDGRLRCHVRLDERSASFFALGIGLGSRRPALLLTTSGTAATELQAALTEAHQARVPLLACTADRPAELHGVGAPQVVDQGGIYARLTRYEADLAPCGLPEQSWRSISSRLVAETMTSPLGPGPVHANLAFSEPLVGEPGVLPPGRPGRRAWHEVLREDELDRGLPPVLAAVVERGGRGVIVAGASSSEASEILGLSRLLGWPILADPRSRCRVGAPLVVGAADGILRSSRFAEAYRPEVVLCVGEPPASKVVAEWIAACGRAGTEIVLVDPDGLWRDPARVASFVLRCSAGRLAHHAQRSVAIAARRASPERADKSSYAEGWQLAEHAAQASIAGLLAAEHAPTEPGVARQLYQQLPAEATLVVSSSMPIRDLEWFAGTRPDPPRVLANRGANGIDGVVSTTLGVATSLQHGRAATSDPRGTGEPASPAVVVGLLGDLALLHDASGLLRARGDCGPAVVFVILDNDGGGIFSFLPTAQALALEEFERFFQTPQEVDIPAVARGYGWDVEVVTSLDELGEALGHAIEGASQTLLIVRSEIGANLALHSALEEAVTAAVEKTLKGRASKAHRRRE